MDFECFELKSALFRENFCKKIRENEYVIWKIDRGRIVARMANYKCAKLIIKQDIFLRQNDCDSNAFFGENL